MKKVVESREPRSSAISKDDQDTIYEMIGRVTAGIDAQKTVLGPSNMSKLSDGARTLKNFLEKVELYLISKGE